MKSQNDSQCEEVLRHLREGHTLTQLQAGELYGIGRLSGRIHNLKEAGHLIESTMIPVRNRHGKTSHVACYKLLKPKPVQLQLL